jgi:hypothetical protein
MGKRGVGAQRPFTMIVAALRSGSDPSRGAIGNPIVAIETYTSQSFPEIPGRGPECFYAGIKGTTTRKGLLSNPAGTPQNATGGRITVASNAFLGPTSILLGEYKLTTGDDFLIGVDAAATAVNLTALINGLPGYTGFHLGAGVISLSGPVGPVGNEVLLGATGVSPGNFTLTPLAGAEPLIGAATIT